MLNAILLQFWDNFTIIISSLYTKLFIFTLRYTPGWDNKLLLASSCKSGHVSEQNVLDYFFINIYGYYVLHVFIYLFINKYIYTIFYACNSVCNYLTASKNSCDKINTQKKNNNLVLHKKNVFYTIFDIQSINISLHSDKSQLNISSKNIMMKVHEVKHIRNK